MGNQGSAVYTGHAWEKTWLERDPKVCCVPLCLSRRHNAALGLYWRLGKGWEGARETLKRENSLTHVSLTNSYTSCKAQFTTSSLSQISLPPIHLASLTGSWLHSVFLRQKGSWLPQPVIQNNYQKYLSFTSLLTC